MTPVFFAVKNLTEQTTSLCVPWEFVPTATISDQVRHSKKDRQEWYRSTATAHQFYTAIEGVNPNQRVSKSNPPHRIHAIVADYDLPLDPTRIGDAISKMKYPPFQVERSLGGNVRLVWTLSRPLMAESKDFTIFILQQAKKWLSMELLPGLDEPALEDPCRLYCGGAEWAATGAPAIAEPAIQKFFFDCGERFNFRDIGTGAEIPLDIVEAELRKKYPAFKWPGDFQENASGPSFWVPGSESTNSAIVKKGGMFTFSAHADRPFYDWDSLLGADFTAEFKTNCISTATSGIYFDGRLFWLMNDEEGRYISMSKETLITHLRVYGRVSSAHDKKTGLSMLERCLAHINVYNHVEGAAPILFQPVGRIDYNGTKLVNTAPKSKLVRPSGVSGAWGENFLFVAAVLDNLFSPVEPQRTAFLSWLAHFFKHAYDGNPSPGQNLVLCGGPGVGKTLVGREVLGGLMGSHCDASKFLTGESNFNSPLFSSAVWCVDDEMCAGSDAANRTFTAHLKSCAANQSFTFRKKFENDVTISWAGRIIVSMNADEVSLRSLPSLEGNILDKISLFRCAPAPLVIFPERHIIKQMLVEQLPHFAQWLLDFQIPTEWVGDSRYGTKPFHESTLIDRSHQSGRSASFKEILIQYLQQWFADNPQAKEYRASVTQLVRGLHADFLNESIMRSLKLEQINRHCEAIAKEGVLVMRSETGARKTRLWIVERFV